MPTGKDYRYQGRRLKTADLAERLLPDLHMNEFVAWPPDLFAFTSYILSITSAYQLVISPPIGERWPPKNKDLKEWLGIKWDGKKWGMASDNDIEKKIFRWLNGFLTDVIDSKVDKKWLLDPDELSDSQISSDADKVETFRDKKTRLKDRISILAENITEKALKELSEEITEEVTDDTRPSFIEDFKKMEKLRLESILAGKRLSQIERKAFEKELKELSEKQSVSLGEFLINNESSGWIKFVQKLGDNWNHNLSSLKDKEFQLINHCDDDEEGNIFRKRGDSYPARHTELDRTALPFHAYRAAYIGTLDDDIPEKNREKKLFSIILKTTPSLILVCWAFFYHLANSENFYVDDPKQTLDISDLLCNRDEVQMDGYHRTRLWHMAQAIFTMHAISDICCTTWGIYPVIDHKKEKAKSFAEDLLYDKGSLSTINPERGRVLPKRHNPGVGITLRSISSNLAFHQTSVEVVWRKTRNTDLEKHINIKKAALLQNDADADPLKSLSILLLPFPLDVKAKDFGEDVQAKNKVEMASEYGFFRYDPQLGLNTDQIKTENRELIDKLYNLIVAAKEELESGRFVDVVVLPEGALSAIQMQLLEEKLTSEFDKYKTVRAEIEKLKTNIETREQARIEYEKERKNKPKKPRQGSERTHPDNRALTAKFEQIRGMTKPPSVIIAGVRETRDFILGDINFRNHQRAQKERNGIKRTRMDQLSRDFDRLTRPGNINFDRNAVYCKYYDGKSYTPTPDRYTCKFKQYKHHRWQLTQSQIKSYGLSQVLETENHKIWWEAMKVPKRRVSFLNVGNAITISHLVCEDLARQDPIADLIRHVGPSLVVSLLMDGPQLNNRWSSRYASILSDDPGSSVITLTSFGMVKRFNSQYGPMSRVIALWSESQGVQKREIELANSAEAVLLTVKLTPHKERTADGREERVPTNTLRLMDVIQIYPYSNRNNKDEAVRT